MEDYQPRNDDGQTGEGICRLADIAITIQFTRARALAYLSLASLIKATFSNHNIGGEKQCNENQTKGEWFEFAPARR